MKRVLCVKPLCEGCEVERFGLLPLSLFLACAICAGCADHSADSKRGEAGSRAGQRTVVVFGAASTTNAIEEIIDAFQRESGVKVTVNFASSATLAQQITKGAGADLFLSANVMWMDSVEKEDLVARRVDLLGNRLVVIVPADSRLKLRTHEALKAAPIDRLALADPSSAPVGIYAKQALETLGLWADFQQKVVAGADVRQALAYVEQGAAAAGIVYATDAFISDRVKIVMEMPPEASAPVVYPLALMRSAEGVAAAESLYSYLQSPEAAVVFKKYGFTTHRHPAGVNQ